MSKAKRFFWLKFRDDFFNSKEIRKLRRMENGDTFTVVYLKMQLLSIRKEGMIVFEGTEKDLAEQLSLQIDEDEDDVRVTLEFLYANNLIEQITNENFLLTKVPNLIGSETDSAERMRRLRANSSSQTQKASLCSPDVRKSDTEREIEREIEKEKEKKKTKEKAGKKELVYPPSLSLKRRESLEQFAEYRKKDKGISLTQRALDMIVKRVSEFTDEEVLEAVEVAISCNYQGLFPKHGKKKRETKESYSLDMDGYEML